MSISLDCAAFASVSVAFGNGAAAAMVDRLRLDRLGDFTLEKLRNLIETHENWLIDRVLRYAAANGYTADSSTLELPWRESICGFSEPMQLMLAEKRWPPDIKRALDPNSNPIGEFAATEARLHRQRGVPLDQYMGLTKYYRRAYLELVSEHFPPGADADRYKQFIDLFFDNAEISICAKWEWQDTSEALREAAKTTRLLTNEKNRYLTIFESLNEPVIIFDDAGRVTNLNLAASLLFDEDAISGQGYYSDNRDGRPDPQIAALIDHAGGAAELEHQLVTRGGTRTFHVKIQRMLDVSEKFTGTVIILSDITDFRAAQRAADAANRAKTAFLATMSHEIRTPINGILGIGELLREAPLSGVQGTYVDALLSSGELLRDLVNDVLDYSKLEAGETDVQPVVFSPRDMVRRIARLSIGEARRKGLELKVEIGESCPSLVKADSGKVQRILLNLINNAVKFTQEGTVSISVDHAEACLCFAVLDTGPGIPDADRKRVFEPFFQRPATGTEPPPVGTGLGLPICKRLAEALGAELTLEMADGGGSAFRLDCPVDEVDRMAEEVSPRHDAVQTLDILLVEDNQINAMVIEGFLESDGHRIDTVSSGEAALARLGAQPYEMVLMDIRLLGADGFETIASIRSSADPAVSRLPILVLTADQTDEVARLFASSGANAFQSKPFSRDELRRAIRRALGPSSSGNPIGETQSQPDVPVLDASVIAEHREIIGSERTTRILSTFLETAPHHEAALHEAVRTGDGVAMAHIAHTLKSAAEMTGLRRLGRSADAVEIRIAKGWSEDTLAEMADTLCQQIEMAMEALRNADGTTLENADF
ncbi:MAG: ATP-binding protein [Pseudomonadota bacterium]